FGGGASGPRGEDRTLLEIDADGTQVLRDGLGELTGGLVTFGRCPVRLGGEPFFLVYRDPDTAIAGRPQPEQQGDDQAAQYYQQRSQQPSTVEDSLPGLALAREKVRDPRLDPVEEARLVLAVDRVGDFFQGAPAGLLPGHFRGGHGKGPHVRGSGR